MNPFDIWISSSDWDYDGTRAFEDALNSALMTGRLPLEYLMKFLSDSKH